MSAAPLQEEFRRAGAPHRAQSFTQLAELAQRYLGCEAAVVTLDPVPCIRRRPSDRAASAAFRPGSDTARDAGLDLRTLTHPLVARGRGMRFYAGLPLRDRAGRPIGMLAAMDRQERPLAPEELEILKLLAAMASDLFETLRMLQAA